MILQEIEDITLKNESDIYSLKNISIPIIQSDLEDNTNQITSLSTGKVDKITGKGLSTNDYTTTEKIEVAKVVLKADKTYVDTQIQLVASGSPKGIYASLSALVTAVPTGNNNIYVTSNNGNWNYWNGSAWVSGGAYQSTLIADSDIVSTKLDSNITKTISESSGIKLKYGKNLFNSATSSVGYLLGADGNLLASAAWGTSDFIELTPSLTVTLNRARFVAEFDVYKKFIPGTFIDCTTAQKLTTFTPNVATKYTKFSYELSQLNTYKYQLEIGSSATVFEAYREPTLLKIDNTPVLAKSASSSINSSMLDKTTTTDYVNTVIEDKLIKRIANTYKNEITIENVLSVKYKSRLIPSLISVNTMPYAIEDIKGIIRLNYDTTTLTTAFFGVGAGVSTANNVYGLWIDVSTLTNISSIAITFDYYNSSNAYLNTLANGYNIPIASLVTGYYDKRINEGINYTTKVREKIGNWAFVTVSLDSILVGTTKIVPSLKLTTTTTNSIGFVDVCNPTFVNGLVDLDPSIVYTASGEKAPTTKDGIASLLSSDIATLINNINNLYGKIYNAIGDSLTYGHLTGNSISYPTKIANRNNMTATNYGLNGSRISHTSVNEGMVDRYSSMGNANYISVWGGINDWYQNVPMGTNDSVDITTFKGALNVLCLGLRNKYPSGKIGFMTPLYNSSSITNSLGIKLVDYVDAIKDICELYAIPVLDLYRNSGIITNNVAQNAFLGFSRGDYTHLNGAGYDYIVPQIESFLRGL